MRIYGTKIMQSYLPTNAERQAPLRIIFVGYMGAGKSTLGKVLSKTTGIPYYDLDTYIENRMRKSIAHIFEEQGEQQFRKTEYNMLHEVAEFEHIILSCGGGTPCYYDNMEYLNQQGETIYLKTDAGTLFQHLQMARIPRPLLKGMTDEEAQQFIERHLQEREPFYMKAKHVHNVTLLDTHEKIAETIEIIRKELNI